jgi:hypothetical protein
MGFEALSGYSWLLDLWPSFILLMFRWRRNAIGYSTFQGIW